MYGFPLLASPRLTNKHNHHRFLFSFSINRTHLWLHSLRLLPYNTPCFCSSFPPLLSTKKKKNNKKRAVLSKVYVVTY